MFLHSANFCEADDITMTSEQARVVVHPITRGEVLKVVAFAGTCTCECMDMNVHIHLYMNVQCTCTLYMYIYMYM